ncbi:cupin domain-containing protein [Nonomuraea africana]|uniref:Mannose-6-phosphate isomerase-like protein (Cupin superfamily) n=1 Tax=Nonomuraea africana TaxID=46171 RepID=A0ABR9K782_9ACTN|nr:cupin domain-containing protein [Nonomuraea africana]MBE1557872.1 mannose-6-phosphate isomerase-like protein (cupin superfamily) [Nonomuraea africana]
MPVVLGATAPVFTIGTTRFTGLAAPSRGAKETCVWRTHVAPHTEPNVHSFDREEVLVVTSGAGVAHLDGVPHPVGQGDAIVVPAGTLFALGNPHDEPLELVVALPVGALARLADGSTVVPPAAV